MCKLNKLVKLCIEQMKQMLLSPSSFGESPFGPAVRVLALPVTVHCPRNGGQGITKRIKAGLFSESRALWIHFHSNSES